MRERNDARREAMQERSRLMREWADNQRSWYSPGSEQIRQAMENRHQLQRYNSEAWRRWVNPRGAYMSDWSKARQLYFDKLSEERMKHFDNLISAHPWGPYSYSR
jgi:hypothetical protein